MATSTMAMGEVQVAARDGHKVPYGTGLNKEGEKTNVLLQQLITQNAKKPQISPVGLYEVQ